MTTTVKLSAETRDLLKTASLINNSIKIEAGNVIKTVHESGAVLLEAEVPETFPETFSIYELNRFLSVLSLPNMKGADLIFSGQNFVEVKSGKASIKYKFTEASFIQHPGRQIVLPSEDLIIDLTSEDISNTMKMASVLGHKYLEFRAEGGKAYITTTSPDLSDASNDSLVEIADVPGTADGSYKIKLDNLVMPTGDYKVTVCAQGISKFEHKTRKVTGYIGLERA